MLNHYQGLESMIAKSPANKVKQTAPESDLEEEVQKTLQFPYDTEISRYNYEAVHAYEIQAIKAGATNEFPYGLVEHLNIKPAIQRPIVMHEHDK